VWPNVWNSVYVLLGIVGFVDADKRKKSGILQSEHVFQAFATFAGL